MDKDTFLHPENWHGGPTYDLSMAWPTGDDQQLLRALAMIWQGLGIAGPWNDPTDFPQNIASIKVPARGTGLQTYGLLTLANGVEVGCIVYAIPEENAASVGGLDWLCVDIYRGMQERAFNFVYSDHIRRDNPWLAQIDEQYLRIAERVYAVAPFMAALIDFEGPAPFGDVHEGLREAQRYGSGCLIPVGGQWEDQLPGWIERPSGLRWRPPQE